MCWWMVHTIIHIMGFEYFILYKNIYILFILEAIFFLCWRGTTDEWWVWFRYVGTYLFKNYNIYNGSLFQAAISVLLLDT